MNRLGSERDLLRALLALGEATEVEPFLERVVAWTLGATGATTAYLAVGPGFSTARPRWWRAHALDPDQLEGVRRRLSTTLLAQAARDGVVATTDATDDRRFRETVSVRTNRIRAVVCAALRPAGGGAPIGVLYVERSEGPFDADAVGLVGLVGDHLGGLAQRLLMSRRGDEPDPTQVHRARLAASALVGQSPALARVLEMLVVAASAPVPVLLTGPTGTGKTTIARVLHESTAATRSGPLVEVNAAHLEPQLALAELFGARAGSFTGATRDRAGLVEEAAGGTLFIDEVTELEPSVQVKLLSFLQDGTVRWLGESRSRRVGNVRVVTASNVDPATSDRFRTDLLHRLRGLQIEVPPLAERTEDIADLAHAIVDRFARLYGIRSRPLSASACAWLEARPWPGNVRDLENVVRHGLLWAHHADAAAIRPSHLDRSQEPAEPEAEDLRSAVDRYRLAYVRRVVRDCGGNKTEAAARLGITRQHVHEILRRIHPTLPAEDDNEG